MRRTLAAAGVAALLLFFGTVARTAPGPRSEFIWISDVHFDPTANAALTDALAEASVDKWAKIFQSSPGRPSKFGQDTDWALLEPSLAEIRKRSPHAQFTVLTGDFFVHNFRKKFDQAAKNHDDEAFRRFAAKTFQFVAAQLEALTPGKPVLFTLGNNDSDCGDYELQPHGAFLKDTDAAVTNMLGALADGASEADWSATGSYSVRHPALKHYRVIALNSVYFSPRYRNACATTTEEDPAKNEMDWLASKLADAKAHREKVWLLFHIPPGIDGYATSHPKSGSEKRVVRMWAPAYTETFQTLLEQYHETVTISLAGHEHMDDFRLVDNSLVLLAPGLSPVVNQNPAFRVVTYGTDGTLTNASTYYLPNLTDFDNGTASDWKAEYSFAQWDIKRLTFQDFSRLYHEVEVHPETRARWTSVYGVSHPEGGSITRETFPWLFCAAGNVMEAGYNECLKRVQVNPQ